MIPVTLSKLDNYPGFVGSFDLVNWWKSQPIPGDIDIVNDVVWVYGQYHVCSAKMTDGTYSIFQSRDNGYSWTLVLNTVETINTIMCPDYGIAVAATSGGWWRSINSGTTWSKVSTSATDCFCVKDIGNNILIALSRRNVWRSTNNGTTWTSIKTTSTDISYPAVDGTIYDLLFGHGGTMWYSDDAGTTWYDISSRMRAVFPSGTGVIGTITDIELTGISGYYVNPGGRVYDDVPTFIAQFRISNGILRHYYLLRTPSADETADSYYMFGGAAKFDALSSIKNSLCSTYSQHTGSATTDKLIVFTGTDVNYRPLINYSTDHGVTWQTCNLKNATIYNGPDLSQVSTRTNPFTEDVYISASYSHGAYCHNYFEIVGLWVERNQSLDMDFRTSVTRSEEFSIDTLIALRLPKTYSMDIINKLIQSKSITSDMLVEVAQDESYSFNTLIQKTRTNTIDLDVVSVLRFNKTYTIDELLLKTVSVPLKIDTMIEGTNTSSTTMDIIIYEQLPILHNTERYHMQAFAIGVDYPKRSYPIFDSRFETKT